MNRLLLILTAAAASVVIAACGSTEPTSSTAADSASIKFSNPTEIDNPWLPLSTLTRSVAEGNDGGVDVQSIKTRLDRTETFEFEGQTVEVLVVEDKSFEDGELHEVALDFFGQADDGTVYYFGEDVNYYEKGKVVGHEGAFRYGEDTDVLGVAMPADPQVGDSFSIETVPNVGTETNEVTAIDASVDTPAGSFSPALQIDGHVEPDNEDEVKLYAEGIGVISEQGPGGEVSLVDPGPRR